LIKVHPLVTRAMGGIHCWRVEDDSSIACYSHRNGIWAGDIVPVSFSGKSENERQQLAFWLSLHLVWGNRIRTPFISVYNNRGRAEQEAARRVDARKSNVVIYKIRVPDWDNSRRVPVEFRKVRKLTSALGVEIPAQAYHNSEIEFVFLHHIPEKYIECTWVADSD
jgi:hypothetical protein